MGFIIFSFFGIGACKATDNPRQPYTWGRMDSRDIPPEIRLASTLLQDQKCKWFYEKILNRVEELYKVQLFIDKESFLLEILLDTCTFQRNYGNAQIWIIFRTFRIIVWKIHCEILFNNFLEYPVVSIKISNNFCDIN